MRLFDDTFSTRKMDPSLGNRLERHLLRLLGFLRIVPRTNGFVQTLKALGRMGNAEVVMHCVGQQQSTWRTKESKPLYLYTPHGELPGQGPRGVLDIFPRLADYWHLLVGSEFVPGTCLKARAKHSEESAGHNGEYQEGARARFGEGHPSDDAT